MLIFLRFPLGLTVREVGDYFPDVVLLDTMDGKPFGICFCNYAHLSDVLCGFLSFDVHSAS